MEKSFIFFWQCKFGDRLFDNKKVRHSPREWFTVPLKVIEEAIPLIISEEIVHYRYDNEKEMIEKIGR